MSRPSKLAAILEALTPEERTAFNEHLSGGTSAEWLAEELTRAGHPISATAIKEYRRRVRQAGV